MLLSFAIVFNIYVSLLVACLDVQHIGIISVMRVEIWTGEWLECITIVRLNPVPKIWKSGLKYQVKL